MFFSWMSGPLHTLANGWSRQLGILYEMLEVGKKTDELHSTGDSCKSTQNSVLSENGDDGDMIVEDGDMISDDVVIEES